MKILLIAALFSVQLLWTAVHGQTPPPSTHDASTDAEKQLDKRCRESLESRDKYEVALIHFTIGADVLQTNEPNTDEFLEDCSTIAVNPSRDSSDIRSIVKVDDMCYDVLFESSGKPIVCGYKKILDNGTHRKPSTEEQRRLESECRERLERPFGTDAGLVLFEADPKDKFPGFFTFNSTHPADGDPYNEEDCGSVFGSTPTSGSAEGIAPPRTIIVIMTSTAPICHEILFYENEVNPVVCLPSTDVPDDDDFAPGMTDYVPRTEEHKRIEEECKQNLEHPNGTRVALVLYEANPKDYEFPGFYTLETNLPGDGNPYNQENCALVKEPNVTVNTTRTVLVVQYSDTCHNILYYEDEVNPVVCLYLIPSNVTLPEGLKFVIHKPPAIIVLFFTSLSVIASAVLLATHFIFPSLQTLPSKVIMNLATAFLLGDIFIIVQTSLILDDPNNTEVIDAIVIVAYYFFYARFVWMALAGFEMCRTIHVGTQLRFNSAGKRLKMLLIYLATGWSLPLIPTVIMAVVHYEKLEDDSLGERSLFGNSGLVIVLVPVGLVMLFNVGTLIYLSYVLYKAHQWQIKVTEAIQSHKRKTNFTRIFIIILSLLGVTWILLFLIYIDGIKNTDPVFIITSIFNSLQPIFVTVSFIGTKKIFRKYKNLFTGQRDDEATETSTIQNRFSKRRLISFLFTDKELADKVSGHPSKRRFGRPHRNDSKFSNTSVSMLMRDSSNSLAAPSNGLSSPPKVSSPPKDTLAPISEELEEPCEKLGDDSPNHVTIDLKDTTV